MVKSTYCSCIEPRFKSYHQRGDSQLSVTPDPEGSSAVFEYLMALGMHGVHRHACR